MTKQQTFFQGMKEGMAAFGQTVSILVNAIFLTIIYIVGVGITALVAKIFRKRFLDMRLQQEGSYWTTLDLKPRKREDYYRPF